MDLDFDLDSPWPEDPNQFIPSPSSPFPTYHLPPLSSPPPNHPSFSAEFCSPLWVFSDSPSTPKPTIPSSIFPTISPNSGESSEIIAGKLPGNPSAELDSDGSCMMKKRMMQALRFFKESTEQHHVLVQVWVPVKKGDRYVLTTSGQPFVLDPTCSGLLQYRTVSVKYVFSADSEGEGELGLPGRVFRKKLPEWTPNVQYYSSKEYPRLTHALHYDVRGTLALPIFEPSGQSCVGVVELILTAQKVNYAPEVDKVCKALEAVNLKSSEILDHPNMQICNEGRQEALAEILEVLTVVCETHKLPLAQTWVPCRHRSVLADGGGSKKSCMSFDGSCMGQVCMSTTDVAFSVVDAQMWGFREACAEHHLQKDQGVAGRAFASHRSCFSRDITRFNKTEYPLVHYARMFGLTGCVAICLRSAYTGSDDYILEFFLPPNCKEDAEQQALLDSLSTTMKQCFRSLIFISGEPQREDSLEIVVTSVDDKSGLKEFTEIGNLQIEEDVLQDTLDQQFVAEIDAHKNDKNMINTDGSQTRISISKSENKSMKRGLERRRGKAEKSISLEVLQQYFAGSLKDAAKSLGVCPTTMKRICRQHGISRWPSRKINKVTRSICKLKKVIESVQGAEGPFTLPSITTTPFPVAMGSFSCPINLVPEGQSPVVREGKSPSYRIPLNDDREHSGSQPEVAKDSRRSKTRSGLGEESTEDPTSQDSSQGNPIDTQLNSPFVPVIKERAFDINQCLVLACEVNASGRSEPEALGGILVRDSGSCKDFRVLLEDHQQPMAPPPRTVTVKASYKEDIIRFRLAITSGVVELNEEVAKRLKLEIGTFDVKYLDDDHEWVVLACDADLLECMEISRSSGGNMIRLLVHDVVSNFGSSCESSGE